jgi:virulence factor Mce-like protein
MNRRPQASIVANPVLVGAVTTLVVVVAVFLAYNANNGLPFVPTRALKVQIANGANLVTGNEVRSGGFRIGVVEDMQPTMLPSGHVGALLSLKLDKKIGALPVDTTARIRPRSSLGLKYLELTKGSSARTLPDGATLPAAQASVPVELDEFYNMFDAKTRSAAQQDLQGFGDALTGRGADLSTTIQRAPSLFGHLTSVMRNLGAPRTDLKSFFKELGDAARIVAPVSATNAHLFTTMANTFEAFSRDTKALQATITKSPPTLDVSTRSLRVQRPFLEHTAAFSRDLNGATAELRGALPTVNRALEIGTPVTRRSALLYDDLQGAMDALRSLAEAPTTTGALRGLTATVTTLQPQLRFLGPYVTVCNYWTFFWTLAAEHFTSPDPTGGEQRALLNAGPTAVPGVDGNDSVDSDTANEFAHGKVSSTPGAVQEFIHNAFMGNAVTDQGLANCQPGQQGYASAGNPFRDRSIPGDPYKHAFVDNIRKPPPRLGPTYATLDKQGHGQGLNADQVPAGQTFTATPGGLGADKAYGP